MPFTILAWHWLAAGLVLVVLEVLVSGNVLVWLGLPALLLGAAMLLWPDLPLGLQIGLYALLAVLGLALGLLRRRNAAAPVVNTGTARFIGKHAVLTMPISAGRGEVELGDSVWPVSGPDLPAGTMVEITGSDGVVLTVRPLA